MYVSSFLAVLLCPPPHRSAMRAHTHTHTHTHTHHQHHHASEGEQRWVVVIVLQYFVPTPK
jgi:hypothetical protein